MNKIILFAFFLFASKIGQTQITIDKKGLVAYYPFSGNADDQSGKGNNGYASSIQYAPDRFGNQNSAAKFNGYNSYIKIDQSSNMFKSNDFTVSIWLNYVSQAGGTHDYSAIFIKADPNQGHSGITMFIDYPIYNTATCRISGSEEVNSSFGGLKYGIWNNLIFTKSSNIVKIYVNGQLNRTRSLNSTEFSNSSPIFIGCNHTATNSQNYEGLIDDISIFDRSLTEAEISQLATDNGKTASNNSIAENQQENNSQRNNAVSSVINSKYLTPDWKNDKFVDGAITFTSAKIEKMSNGLEYLVIENPKFNESHSKYKSIQNELPYNIDQPNYNHDYLEIWQKYSKFKNLRVISYLSTFHTGDAATEYYNYFKNYELMTLFKLAHYVYFDNNDMTDDDWELFKSEIRNPQVELMKNELISDLNKYKEKQTKDNAALLSFLGGVYEYGKGVATQMKESLSNAELIKTNNNSTLYQIISSNNAEIKITKSQNSDWFNIYSKDNERKSNENYYSSITDNLNQKKEFKDSYADNNFKAYGNSTNYPMTIYISYISYEGKRVSATIKTNIGIGIEITQKK
jgi:hypothetical protein